MHAALSLSESIRSVLRAQPPLGRMQLSRQPIKTPTLKAKKVNSAAAHTDRARTTRKAHSANAHCSHLKLTPWLAWRSCFPGCGWALYPYQYSAQFWPAGG